MINTFCMELLCSMSCIFLVNIWLCQVTQCPHRTINNLETDAPYVFQALLAYALVVRLHQFFIQSLQGDVL